MYTLFSLSLSVCIPCIPLFWSQLLGYIVTSATNKGSESDRITKTLTKFFTSFFHFSFTALSCLILTGDMDYNWLDHTSWHSSEASPMSLVRHVEPYHSVSFIIYHFTFPLFYLHLCMFSFLYLFFLSCTCREQSKGKKKN